MNKTVFQIILITLFALYNSVSTADVPAKMIAYSCYSCHGEKLINLKLSQPLSALELTQSLLAFKNRIKSASIMDRITNGFTDAELKAVANYLSQLN